MRCDSYRRAAGPMSPIVGGMSSVLTPSDFICCLRPNRAPYLPLAPGGGEKDGLRESPYTRHFLEKIADFDYRWNQPGRGVGQKEVACDSTYLTKTRGHQFPLNKSWRECHFLLLKPRQVP